MSLTLDRRKFLESTALATAVVALPACSDQKDVPLLASDPFIRVDATTTAAMIRNGEVSALEVTDAAIKRIEVLEPQINALTSDMFEIARETAKAGFADGPFAGVPFLIKDLNDVAGQPRASGSRLYANNVASENAPIADAAAHAGLNILGKSATPEFGLLATTESVLNGPTRNPWNLDHSTGGSSGGAAAAVASGMIPMAHANDGGGSIRIPASCCGVFGLKPSRGRVVGDDPAAGSLSVNLVVSRSVRDSAGFLAIAERRDGEAPHTPVGLVEGSSDKKLRVALMVKDYFGALPHPEVASAAVKAGVLMESLGHTVTEIDAPIDGTPFVDAFMTMWSYGPYEYVTGIERRGDGSDPSDLLEPWTVGLADWHMQRCGDDRDACVQSALSYFEDARKAHDKVFETYDIILSPTLAAPPIKIGAQAPTVDFQTLWDRITHYVTYTPGFNASGHPAMSVPLAWSSGGLPIGIQFAAALGAERTLLEVAYALERAQPWKDRWAPVSAVNL